jgi:protein-disulfide isomerase
MSIVKRMVKNTQLTDKLLPGLLVIIVLMAFAMGVMWTKLQSLEKGSVTTNTNTQAAVNNPPAAAPTPAKLSDQQFQELITSGDAPVMGNTNAKVTIVEFSDLQCPFCKSFADQTLPQIKKDYIDTGKVKLIYRHYPLRSLHPFAYQSALASECAKEQGKFWEFHDETYKNQATLSSDSIKQFAKTIGLNTAKFNACLDSEKYKDVVTADESLGNGVGVSGTPAFFVNGTLIGGAQPFDNFKTVIEAAL